jgi:hypothetical protein
LTLGPDLFLDRTTGDLAIEGGDLVLAADLAQAISIRLKWFRNEYFLNTSIGVPYYDQIFVKAPRLDQIAALYRDEIARTPGVTKVLTVDVSLNNSTRELKVTWRAEGADGVVAGVVEV